jgi:hypothetical protein
MNPSTHSAHRFLFQTACGILLVCASGLRAQDEKLKESFLEEFKANLLGNKTLKLIPMRGGMGFTQSVNEGVTLNGGAMLVRPIVGGGRVIWTLNLDFLPDGKAAAAPLFTKFGFVLANQTIMTVNFALLATEPNPKGDLSFEVKQNNAPGGKAKLLRDTMHDQTFGKGVWLIEYNQGMLEVTSPEGAVYCAYEDGQGGVMIPVIGLVWEQHEGSVKCRTMRADSTAAPVEPSEAAKAELRKASALNQKAMLLSRGGEWEEALVHMREASGLFLKHRGELSRDYANSLGNLASILNGCHRDQEVIATHQRSIAVFRKVLGPDHPAIALEVGSLCGALIAGDRDEEAIPLLQDAVRICDLVGGDAGKLSNALSDLLKLVKAKVQTAKPEIEGGRSEMTPPKNQVGAGRAMPPARVVPNWQPVYPARDMKTSYPTFVKLEENRITASGGFATIDNPLARAACLRAHVRFSPSAKRSAAELWLRWSPKPDAHYRLTIQPQDNGDFAMSIQRHSGGQRFSLAEGVCPGFLIMPDTKIEFGAAGQRLFARAGFWSLTATSTHEDVTGNVLALGGFDAVFEEPEVWLLDNVPQESWPLELRDQIKR